MKIAKRNGRVAEQIRQIMSDVILNKMKDPRLGFITITRVTVTEDLKYAKVYFSVYGSEKEKKGTEAVLTHSINYLQHELLGKLKMRTQPKLSFTFDPSIEHAFVIDEVIRKIHEEQ